MSDRCPRVAGGPGQLPGPSGGERVWRYGEPGGSAAAWPAFYAVSVETLTFLFTDIEGSTALLGRLGEDGYAQVLAGHHALIRSALAAHDGREVDTQGDAFFAVFSSPGVRGGGAGDAAGPGGPCVAGRGAGTGADGDPLRGGGADGYWPGQLLLARLSVFVGGFGLDAAEVVCGSGALDVLDVADLLGSLVDKSLVVAEPAAGILRPG